MSIELKPSIEVELDDETIKVTMTGWEKWNSRRTQKMLLAIRKERRRLQSLALLDLRRKEKENGRASTEVGVAS